MAQIYLMRHGQTDMNIQHMLQGRTNTHLNETGKEMARGAGTFLEQAGIHPDLCLVSPLDRVKETVAIATGIDPASFQEEPLLIEFCFGKYEGVPACEMAPDFHHMFFEEPDKCVMPSDAESYQDILGRARAFLQKMAENYTTDDRTIFCGTHGGFLHALLVEAQGKALADFWDVPVKNCAVFRLDINVDPAQPSGYSYHMEQIFEGFGDSYSKNKVVIK